MTNAHFQLAKAEHEAWRKLFLALKAKNLLGPGDETARISDRSTPKREWFTDAYAWLRTEQPSTELEGRFGLLFLDAECNQAMRQWVARALELRPYVRKV